MCVMRSSSPHPPLIPLPRLSLCNSVVLLEVLVCSFVVFTVVKKKHTHQMFPRDVLQRDETE